MRIGIIGAGLIGTKRAHSILECGDKVVAIVDKNETNAKKLASSMQSVVEKTGESLCARTDIDAVVIATSNDAIPQYALAALERDKHVLLEKPAGRFPAELKRIEEASIRCQKVAAVGYNHRFHPALQKAKKRLDEIGTLLYFRARYGHGGRIGYEKEWRANPELSGGGELMDQGCHLIDLCRWLGGEFILEYGLAHTFFWEMPVEDNAFLLLKSPDGIRYAWLHASCTEWKNLFELEAFGTKGRIQICGLGRSYGMEELKIYKINRANGAPDIETESFAELDTSWNLEWNAFKNAIQSKDNDIATISDAIKTMDIIHAVYQQSELPFAKLTPRFES